MLLYTVLATDHAASRNSRETEISRNKCRREHDNKQNEIYFTLHLNVDLINFYSTNREMLLMQFINWLFGLLLVRKTGLPGPITKDTYNDILV